MGQLDEAPETPSCMTTQRHVLMLSDPDTLLLLWFLSSSGPVWFSAWCSTFAPFTLCFWYAKILCFLLMWSWDGCRFISKNCCSNHIDCPGLVFTMCFYWAASFMLFVVKHTLMLLQKFVIPLSSVTDNIMGSFLSQVVISGNSFLVSGFFITDLQSCLWEGLLLRCYTNKNKSSRDIIDPVSLLHHGHSCWLSRSNAQRHTWHSFNPHAEQSTIILSSLPRWHKIIPDAIRWSWCVQNHSSPRNIIGFSSFFLSVFFPMYIFAWDFFFFSSKN